MATAAATAQQNEVAAPWWHRLRWRAVSKAEGMAAERALLSLHGPPPVQPVETSVGPTPQHTMHSLQGGASGPPLVAIPGYGAGVGFFFQNYEWLTSRFRVHAVDLLGTGLSGRPRFTARSREEAEDFFVAALETWRQANHLDRFILVGHSMGGYLSATYAMRYPQHVQHLVLVGCAGVGRKPDDWKPPDALQGPIWDMRANMFRAALWGWDAGLTPGVVVRTLGPLGKRLVRNYATRRFGFGTEEVDAFERYLYNILAADGSGEYALKHILEPFAWPRQALEGRLQELRGTPVTFVYGEHDWMDPRHGVRVCKQLADMRTPLNETDQKLFLVDDAGHNPFMEQPQRFHDALAEALRPWLTNEQAHPVHTVGSESALPKHADEPQEGMDVAADL